MTPTHALENLPLAALPQIASYFQVLAEPTRLHMLSLLAAEEQNVGDLARTVGTSVANASRHLAILCQNGFISRESRGNSVYYRIADGSVQALCDVVCGSIVSRYQDMARQQAAFSPLLDTTQESSV